MLPEPREAIDPGANPGGLIVWAWIDGVATVELLNEPDDVEAVARRHFDTADRVDVYDGDAGGLVAVCGPGWALARLPLDGEELAEDLQRAADAAMRAGWQLHDGEGDR